MINNRFVLSGLIALMAAALYFNFRQPAVIEVEVTHLQTGEVRQTVSNTRVGTVKACRRAYLAPATGGQVAKLPIKEGEQVNENQILMEIWNQDLKARVAEQEAQVLANQAAAEQACQLKAGALREAERISRLQRFNHIVSEEQVDTKVTQAKAQSASCRAAEASVSVSLAARDMAQAALERTFVKAPFKGTVAEINAELGEYVTPSPPGIPTLPAVDLLDVSCLYVSAPIDEVDAPKIKTGMAACVSLDAFEGKRCSGTVSRIAPYVLEKEKQARTVEVEVKLTDPKDLKELLPGYSADIEVLLSTKPETLRVPSEAVVDGNKVLLLQDNGILAERVFTPGFANWNYVEVVEGLSAGDRVVLSVGADGVAAGVKARAKP